jgi:hypothetical protein
MIVAMPREPPGSPSTAEIRGPQAIRIADEMSGFNPVDEIGLIVAEAVPELLGTEAPGRRPEVKIDFLARRYSGLSHAPNRPAPPRSPPNWCARTWRTATPEASGVPPALYRTIQT